VDGFERGSGRKDARRDTVRVADQRRASRAEEVRETMPIVEVRKMIGRREKMGW
jgi:hypothetical protein